MEQFPELAKAINVYKSFYEAIYFPIKYVLSSEKHLVERYGEPDAPSFDNLEVWSACMTPCMFDQVSVPDGLKDSFFAAGFCTKVNDAFEAGVKQKLDKGIELFRQLALDCAVSHQAFCDDAHALRIKEQSRLLACLPCLL